MASRGLILVALISFAAGASASEMQLRKCCPPGEVFRQGTVCDSVAANALELYSVDYDGVSVQQNRFPICEEPEDVNTTKLFYPNDTDFLQMPACIDILHVESTHDDAVIAVTCQSKKNKDEEREKKNAIQMLSVRRCCPKDMVFELAKKSCVTPSDAISDANYTDASEFLELLSKPLDGVKFLNVSKGPPNCKSNPLLTYEISAEDISFENGSLWVTLPATETGSYEMIPASTKNTCLELTRNSRINRQLVFRVCRDEKFCQEHSCIRKCCPEDHVLNEKTFQCTKSNYFIMPQTFYNEISTLLNESWSDIENGLVIGKYCKNDAYSLSINETYLTRRGQLVLKPNAVHDYHSYCLDILDNSTVSMIPMLCFSDTKPTTPWIKFVITSILESISCFFLLLTLLVYIYLPSLQNLHGKTLMCHSASLLVAYICLAIVPWVTPFRDTTNTVEISICKALGYLMLFSLLSSFCWLNVMCFDIWRTFGRLRGNGHGGQSHTKKFVLYSIYAWSLPLLITAFCVVADSTSFVPNSVRPKFGEITCWFRNDMSMSCEMIYFRAPVLIQLLSNVVFFILTSEHCSKVKAEIRRVADPTDIRSKRFHADKTKLIMNIKLFIVMGITWLAEVASSLMNAYTDYEWKEMAFYISDAINCLQGLLIFILFVLKSRVYQALKRRSGFGMKKKCSSQGTSTLSEPSKVKKSASNSTLTSSFAVSVAP